MPWKTRGGGGASRAVWRDERKCLAHRGWKARLTDGEGTAR